MFFCFFKPKFKENLIRIKFGFRFCYLSIQIKLFRFLLLFFSKLMSIFFMLYLFRYFMCKDIYIYIYIYICC